MAQPTLLTPVAPHVAAPREPAGRRRLTWGSALLAAFVLLTACMALHVFNAFDTSLDTRFHDYALAHSDAVSAAKALALLGEPSIALGGGLLLAALCYLRRNQQAAYFFVVASIGASALASVVKLLIDRHRPVWPVPVTRGSNSHAAGSSYPSGHATGSATLAAMLIIGVVPLLASAAWRWFATVLLVLYAVAVPISRLVLGVHVPTDVIAGALLGTGWTLLTAALLLRPRSRSRDLVGPPSRLS
jgi:membrane-associated phospholipid phosphatase